MWVFCPDEDTGRADGGARPPAQGGRGTSARQLGRPVTPAPTRPAPPRLAGILLSKFQTRLENFDFYTAAPGGGVSGGVASPTRGGCLPGGGALPRHGRA
jgi:hypothetical protein